MKGKGTSDVKSVLLEEREGVCTTRLGTETRTFSLRGPASI